MATDESAQDEQPTGGDEQYAWLGLTLKLGPKLAAGRDADVFDLGNGRVLRRNRRGESAEREAQIIRHARASGYPAPAVYEQRGPDLVMERLSGPTMLEELGRRPWLLWRHARMLAALHQRLATISPLDWLKPFPPVPDDGTVMSHVSASASLSDTLPQVSAPAGSRDADCLLHLDLHPANIILTPHGPVVIDWSSAKRGPVASAVALTWVIMATSQIDDTGLRLRMVSWIRGLLVAEFLRHVDREAVLRQLPAIARFRLKDRNVLDSERPAIYALARRAGVHL
jgi:aminoglycoside phosphotransferase (APT) family kinase protein